jgi:hypothetical protein
LGEKIVDKEVDKDLFSEKVIRGDGKEGSVDKKTPPLGEERHKIMGELNALNERIRKAKGTDKDAYAPEPPGDKGEMDDTPKMGTGFLSGREVGETSGPVTSLGRSFGREAVLSVNRGEMASPFSNTNMGGPVVDSAITTSPEPISAPTDNVFVEKGGNVTLPSLVSLTEGVSPPFSVRNDPEPRKELGPVQQAKCSEDLRKTVAETSFDSRISPIKYNNDGPISQPPVYAPLSASGPPAFDVGLKRYLFSDTNQDDALSSPGPQPKMSVPEGGSLQFGERKQSDVPDSTHTPSYQSPFMAPRPGDPFSEKRGMSSNYSSSFNVGGSSLFGGPPLESAIPSLGNISSSAISGLFDSPPAGSQYLPPNPEAGINRTVNIFTLGSSQPVVRPKSSDRKRPFMPKK